MARRPIVWPKSIRARLGHMRAGSDASAKTNFLRLLRAGFPPAGAASLFGACKMYRKKEEASAGGLKSEKAGRLSALALRRRLACSWLRGPEAVRARLARNSICSRHVTCRLRDAQIKTNGGAHFKLIISAARFISGASSRPGNKASSESEGELRNSTGANCAR